MDRLATVYCGVIDARYQLRPPTHLELKRWGMAMANAVGEEFLFALVGEEKKFGRAAEKPRRADVVFCFSPPGFFNKQYFCLNIFCRADGRGDIVWWSRWWLFLLQRLLLVLLLLACCFAFCCFRIV